MLTTFSSKMLFIFTASVFTLLLISVLSYRNTLINSINTLQRLAIILNANNNSGRASKLFKLL